MDAKNLDSTANENESDVDELDEKYVEEQLNATVYSDFKQAIYDSRFAAPIIALLGVLLAYHLTIAPYRFNMLDRADMTTAVKDLKTIRPVLSDETLKGIQHIMLRQENEIELPEAIGGGSFTMRFVQDVNKHGTHELPDMFYTGVMFGVSNANSHKVEYSRLQPDRTSKALYEDLLAMKPQPSHVMRRFATCNNTDWSEKGYGVYFSYKDLEAQGMLSSDVLQPWKRVLDPVLWTARKFKQVYITVWYPHQFGEQASDPADGDQYPKRKYKHTNIIQTVIPTRTGLDGLKSTAAVWLMERNSTPVVIPPKIVRDSAMSPQQQQYVSVENF